MTLLNRLTALTGIQYPIVQAPMLGITTPEMTAAASNAGALGSLPLGGLSPDAARKLIQEVKALTTKPFAVNLFVYDYPDHIAVPVFDAMQQLLQQLSAQYHIPYQPLLLEQLPFHSYKNLLPVMIEEKIPVVSFTFGILTDAEISLLHQNNIILQGTATSMEEVQLLNDKNIDCITVQGIEAGGHRGTFLQQQTLPQVPLYTLLQQAIAVTDKPVIAAGGIYDAGTMRTALQQGAQGVQPGTIFIASNESVAADCYKEAVLHASTTILTQSFTGRWARCIPNLFTRSIEDAGVTIPPYPVQNLLTTAIRNWAKQNNQEDFIFLLAGQNAAKAQPRSTADIIRSLVADN